MPQGCDCHNAQNETNMNGLRQIVQTNAAEALRQTSDTGYRARLAVKEEYESALNAGDEARARCATIAYVALGGDQKALPVKVAPSGQKPHLYGTLEDLTNVGRD